MEMDEIKQRINENRSLGLDGLLSNVNGRTAEIINKSLTGNEISVEEGEHLFNMQNTDEISLLAIAADEIRREDVGDVITYVINRNINFTNICDTWCGFCNFMAPEGDGSR